MSNFTGKSGPPKKPTALKLLEGTYNPSLHHDEPQPEPKLFDPPDHLSENARIEWESIAPELFALGLLTVIDRAQLELYCESYAMWLEAKSMCATVDGKDRKVIRAEDGKFRRNPYYHIMRDAGADVHRYLAEFGMSPAARARVSAKPIDGSTRNKFLA